MKITPTQQVDSASQQVNLQDQSLKYEVPAHEFLSEPRQQKHCYDSKCIPIEYLGHLETREGESREDATLRQFGIRVRPLTQ